MKNNKLNSLINLSIFFLLVEIFYNHYVVSQSLCGYVSDIKWSNENIIGIGNNFLSDANNCQDIYKLYGIRLFDALSGNLIGILQDLDIGYVDFIDFSNDGKKIISISGPTVASWSVENQELMHGLYGSVYYAIEWNNNGTRIIGTTPLGLEIRNDILIKTDTSYRASNISANPEMGRFIFGTSQRDSSIFAGSMNNGKIYIWTPNSRYEERILQVDTNPIERLSWHPSMTSNFIASGDTDGKILIWDVFTGQVVNQLIGHTGAIRDLDWSPDGTQIASVGADNTLRVWDWQTGEMEIVNSPQESVTSAAYNSDGTQLAYAGMFANIEDLQIHIISVPLNLMITPTPSLTPTIPTATPTATPTETPTATNTATNTPTPIGIVEWPVKGLANYPSDGVTVTQVTSLHGCVGSNFVSLEVYLTQFYPVNSNYFSTNSTNCEISKDSSLSQIGETTCN